MSKRAPFIVAIVLLLLPVPAAYVGSYLALVKPKNWIEQDMMGQSYVHNYRTRSRLCERVFWPLERIDRQLRPSVWQFPPSSGRMNY